MSAAQLVTDETQVDRTRIALRLRGEEVFEVTITNEDHDPELEHRESARALAAKIAEWSDAFAATRKPGGAK